MLGRCHHCTQHITARNMQVINTGKKGPADPNTVAVATVMMVKK